VLALAGLRRLGLEDRVTEVLPLEVSLPAVGQGALALEARADDHTTRALLEALIPAYGTTGMAARMFGISLPPARGVSWLHVQPALPDRGGC